jgi:hypothetical protein
VNDLVAWLRDALNTLEAIAAEVDETEREWIVQASDRGEDVVAAGPGAANDSVPMASSLFAAMHIAKNDPRAILARVEAERAIVAEHGPTRGYRDVFGLDGELQFEPSDDPADLTYPDAARLCRACGPGDNWQAAQEPYGELPCDTLRWLAYGHRFDIIGYDPTWAPGRTKS